MSGLMVTPCVLVARRVKEATGIAGIVHGWVRATLMSLGEPLVDESNIGMNGCAIKDLLMRDGFKHHIGVILDTGQEGPEGVRVAAGLGLIHLLTAKDPLMAPVCIVVAGLPKGRA